MLDGMASPERPAEVPEDWVLVDCQNHPGCPYTVWVPSDLPPYVLKVHSAECAMAVAPVVLGEPHEHSPVRSDGVVVCSSCGMVVNDWQEQNR
jgi:hypothetical protein